MAGQIRRCQRFIADGVRLVQLVDPDDESVVRFSGDGTVRVIQNEELIDLNDVLPGFELTSDAIFGRLRLD